MPATARVFVALGSNLDDPMQRIREAMLALDAPPFGRCVARSSFYLSAPVGFLDQPDFVNAVVELCSPLAPLALIDALLALEQRLGRTRGARNAPRRIDLDLLACDARRLHTPELTLPHPRAAERAFVLLPWQEIAPEFELPGLGRIADLARALPASAIRRMDA